MLEIEQASICCIRTSSERAMQLWPNHSISSTIVSNVVSSHRDYVKSATDDLLKDVCSNYQQWLVKIPFHHESLLIDRKETKLSRKEKRWVIAGAGVISRPWSCETGKHACIIIDSLLDCDIWQFFPFNGLSNQFTLIVSVHKSFYINWLLSCC